MTEPKKRGPKPKCKECGRKEGEGHYDDCSVGMGVVPHPMEGCRHCGRKEGEQHRVGCAIGEGVDLSAITPCVSAAQAYAMRVWSGQSPTVMPRSERINRVKLALEGQNLPFDGVTLPD